MKVNWKKCYRWSLAIMCGAYMMQTTGCIGEQLLPSFIGLALSTLLSLLFGVPV
ncbi:MAG: hypothetical protein HJJLKODD_01932 [Phycisphaerae bacterium]|nr:hypothetical protein [Phycisphaerae bacterium]